MIRKISVIAIVLGSLAAVLGQAFFRELLSKD